METAIPLHEDLKNIIKEGFLEKESRLLKQWRKRWFVLTPNTLYSFKEQKQYKDPTEILVLKEVTTIKTTEGETQKDYCFKIEVGDQKFFIAASSNSEKEQWIGQIGKAMVKLVQARKGDYEEYD